MVQSTGINRLHAGMQITVESCLIDPCMRMKHTRPVGKSPAKSNALLFAAGQDDGPKNAGLSACHVKVSRVEMN